VVLFVLGGVEVLLAFGEALRSQTVKALIGVDGLCVADDGHALGNGLFLVFVLLVGEGFAFERLLELGRLGVKSV